MLRIVEVGAADPDDQLGYSAGVMQDIGHVADLGHTPTRRTKLCRIQAVWIAAVARCSSARLTCWSSSR